MISVFFCLLRTIFGVIQYASMLPIHVRVNETTFLLGGAAYLSSAIAQIMQAPIFLFISSMRQALLKTLVRHRRWFLAIYALAKNSKKIHRIPNEWLESRPEQVYLYGPSKKTILGHPLYSSSLTNNLTLNICFLFFTRESELAKKYIHVFYIFLFFKI